MPRARLPDAVQLPSGRVYSLTGIDEVAATEPKTGVPSFSACITLVDSGAVVLRSEARPVDVRSLPLSDFHALRAILTRLGWLEEASVEVPCRNCGRSLVHAPCAALELGPFVHRELTHPELDALLDLTARHPVPEIRMGKRTAKDVLLGPLRLVDAAPLHAALSQGPLRMVPGLVRAMGILELGGESSAQKIARALARCSDASWDAITNLFLEAHYPPRLFSIARCPRCGARNDVDAPYDREFSYVEEPRVGSGQDAHPYRPRPGFSANTNGDLFPPFEGFAERARALAARHLEGVRDVSFVVEGGVPSCDDGGEPLLGAYAPPYEGDPTSPSRWPEIVVYYRTFRAIWEEDGPYDWEAELETTIEHELDHHRAFLVGSDPVDEEERHEIANEEQAIVGKRALAERTIAAFFGDVREFLRRTWPVWLLIFVVSLIMVFEGR